MYFEREFESEKEIFHTKLREWQELDDFIQAKKPKPVEPIPRLVFFSGHNATAVDQLIDKQRIFLTLEKPDFREGLVQIDNNQLELKTIGVDTIFVAARPQTSPIKNLSPVNEKGCFEIHPNEPFFSDAWSTDLENIKVIEDEIFKLFSPRNSL